MPAGLADKLTSAAREFAVAFDELRMEDIAAASGVPRATLYYYFAGKDDILAFLLQSMLDDLRVSVATALGAGHDTQQRLREVVAAQLAHLAANPTASKMLLMNLGRAGRVGTIAMGIDEGFHAPVRRLLAEGVARRELADIDVDTAASAIYGAVTIVGLRSLLSTGRIDVDDTVHRLFPIFWSGLAKPPTAAKARKR